MASKSNSSSESSEETSAYSERTLAIIKPEAYEDRFAIEKHIRDNGFTILASRQVKLTPEQAAELYVSHYGRQHFPHLVAQMSSGPIVAMVLAGNDAVQRWKTLMGPAKVAEAQAYWPESLRACYGRRTNYGEYFNGLHGSENVTEALREIHFFFPNMVVGPIPRQWQIHDYIQKHLTPVLLPALTKLSHQRPAEPILWLADELLKHNPNEPEISPAIPEEYDDPRCRLAEEDSDHDVSPK